MLYRYLKKQSEEGPVPVTRLRRCAVRGFTLGSCLIGLAPTLGGCSMTFPMASLRPADDDVTGSLGKVPFGRFLDEEDRRREKAALATALDPQGDGSTIRWENPKTGNNGSITPVGHAYPSDSKICRAFLGELTSSGTSRTLQGTACTVAAGEWAVKDGKSVTKA